MAYLKINGTDYSQYVNKLSITTKHKYTARENASGNLLTKYITKKRNIQVGVIPLSASSLKSLVSAINGFTVTVEFLDPETNSLSTANCIIPTHNVEYYTINAGGTKTKAFTFTCEEK
jgi:hypothetical protein